MKGRQAPESIQRQPFDIILLDILMPEMNGFHVPERLKAASHWPHIPVVINLRFAKTSGLSERAALNSQL
jgi:CheY-like chemotaxis protein